MIRGEKISKKYIGKRKGGKEFFAVSETDFSLEKGKLTVLTGRSGSGKSTLLNILAGLLSPSGGEVFFGEKSLYKLNDTELSEFRNKHIGVIPQGQTAVRSLTVLENILLPYTIHGEKCPNAETAERLTRKLGIEELKNSMPSELSGGELRRMSIARAFIREPEVIFADEPTGDLDDENTEIVLSVLKNAAKDGKAVLLVTHEREAEKYADVLYEMNIGTLHRQLTN